MWLSVLEDGLGAITIALAMTRTVLIVDDQYVQTYELRRMIQLGRDGHMPTDGPSLTCRGSDDGKRK